MGPEGIYLVHGLHRLAKRNGPAPPQPPSGSNSPRRRPPHASQEQAGVQDAPAPEGLHRPRSSASGPGAGEKRVGCEVTFSSFRFNLKPETSNSKLRNPWSRPRKTK